VFRVGSHSFWSSVGSRELANEIADRLNSLVAEQVSSGSQPSRVAALASLLHEYRLVVPMRIETVSMGPHNSGIIRSCLEDDARERAFRVRSESPKATGG
jgi:hypothetical protein